MADSKGGGGKPAAEKNGSASGVAAKGSAAREAPAGEAAAAAQPDPEMLKKVAALRSHIRENFGKVAMAMMMLPRYRQQTLADLQHLLLEPLIRDRIAIAYPANAQDDQLADLAGVAIWASVSEEVDASIREQVKAGVFPVRLKPDDWNSGPINWLLDVIAPDRKATARVIAGFGQVAKEGALRLHPIITRLVDEETLRKMGAQRAGTAAGAAALSAPDKTPALTDEVAGNA